MKLLALILSMMIAITAAGFAFSDNKDGDRERKDYEESKMLMDAGKILPLTELIEKVSQSPNDRVLEAELEKDDGRLIYEIEMLTEGGKVFEYEVDATTGEILKREEED